MSIDVWPGFFFRPARQKPGPKKARRQPGGLPEGAATDREPAICCRRCLQVITRSSDRVSRQGAHRHVFANPNGRVYEIGCFQSVKGCGYFGSPSVEFTWFAGYSWRIVYCGVCSTHLGWVFESTGQGAFHGLILKHLVELE